MDDVRRQPPGPRALDAMRAVLSRFFALSTWEQLAAYLMINAYLATELYAEPQVAKEVAARTVALRCLAAAAASHGLAPGVAPTADQYRAVWKPLGLPMSPSAITRAFDTWGQARTAFEGGRVRETAFQRANRSAYEGRTRTYEDFYEGVRWFLARSLLSARAKHYDVFCEEWNDRLPPGEKPLAKSATIRAQTSLWWEETLAVARGETTREEALARRITGLSSRADSGPLVGRQGVASILDQGCPCIEGILTRPDFPPPVAINGRHRIWRRGDIEAWKAGAYEGGTRAGELRHELVFGAELAALLGIGHPTLHAYLCKAHHRVPPPAGRAGGAYYWLRVDVMKWLSYRSDGR